MFKKNESAPEKLPPTRIAPIAYVESTLPVDGVTKGIFCTFSTGSESNNRVSVDAMQAGVRVTHVRAGDRVYRPLRCVIM